MVKQYRPTVRSVVETWEAQQEEPQEQSPLLANLSCLSLHGEAGREGTQAEGSAPVAFLTVRLHGFTVDSTVGSCLFRQV